MGVFVFVFPNMPGDVNPSLPIARSLVSAGHLVHYICPFFRAAIEDTGARFHDATAYYPLYNEGGKARKPEIFGAIDQLGTELQLPATDGAYMARVKLAFVEREKTLPGVLKLLDELAAAETPASCIIYDPVLNPEGALAANVRGLPSVALLAFAGPGAWAALVMQKLQNDLGNLPTHEERVDEFQRQATTFEPNLAAIARINAEYPMLHLKAGFTNGALEPVPQVCLVTGSTEAQRDPEWPALVEGGTFYYVGPLLDVPGALRAGGSENKDVWTRVASAMEKRQPGGRIVYVSLGTVTTKEDRGLGWPAKPDSFITGGQLCQAAWGAALDVLGGDSRNVILLTMGKDAEGKARPLDDGDTAPEHALLLSSMPQTDILAAGIDLFVTHGGQNSWVESVMTGTPMLVLPTVGDQFANALKTEEMGIGRAVDRPGHGQVDCGKAPRTHPAAEGGEGMTEEEASSCYRKEVVRVLTEMLNDEALKEYRRKLQEVKKDWVGGGVTLGIQVITRVANCP